MPVIVYDRFGRRVRGTVCPPGGHVHVPPQFVDARSVQRTFRDAAPRLLHRPGFVQQAFTGDGFEATVSNQRSQSDPEAARAAWIKEISNRWRQTQQFMPPGSRKPKPGATPRYTPNAGVDAAELDPSEAAYEQYKQRLGNMWRGTVDVTAAQDDDYDDTDDIMGIQRADAPDDIQQLSLREQDAYVAAFNQHMEENPDADEEECDAAGRAAVEALGPQDAAADLEAVRDEYHAEYTRRISNAWKT